MPFLLKVFVTALIVAAVSEVGKRYTWAAAILASLPLTSLLALTWIHVESGKDETVADLSWGIFLMVIPSLLFFVTLTLTLKKGLGYWPSLLISCVLTFLAYTVYNWGLKKAGIQL